MTVDLQGHVFTGAGVAINAATVDIFTVATGADESTSSASATASTTTDSTGLWTSNDIAEGAYDVRITSGTELRWLRHEDKISLQQLDVRNGAAAGTPAVIFSNTTNSASNQVAIFRGANTTRADNDEIYLSFELADSGGTLDEFARITAVATDVTATEEDGALIFSVADHDNSGNLQEAFRISSSTGGTVSQTFTTDSVTFGTGGDVDVVINFNANTNDGVLTWMEDEDYFKFSDDILMSSTERISFYDTAIYIYSSTDGQLDLVADTEIQIAATTIDINGAVALNGAITGATNITLSGELDAATLDISGNVDIDGTTNLDVVDIDGNTQVDGTITVGVDNTGYDVKLFGATAGSYWLWDESADGVVQIGTLTVGVDDAGHDVKFFGDTASAYMHWDTSADDLILSGTAQLSIDTTTDASSATTGSFHTDGGVGIAKKLYVGDELDVDGTTNLDAVDIDGAVQIDATFTSGVDGQGYDTKFFGDTSGAYIFWDTSADKLLTAGGAVVDIVKDKLLIGGTAVTTTAAELNILDTATVTATELNLIDGGTSRDTNAIADGDGVLINDNGTMHMTTVQTLATYMEGEINAFSNDIQLDADLDFVGAQSITTSGSTDLTIVPGNDLIVTTGVMDVSKTNSGGTTTLRVSNTSNTSNSEARLLAFVQGTSGGDAYTEWQISGSTVFKAGIDNSASRFVITRGSAIGTDDVIQVTDASPPVITYNTTHPTGTFDYVCEECHAHGPESFECCGKVEWHDDVEALAPVLQSLNGQPMTGLEPGMQHLVDLGVMEVSTQNDGSPWIGVRLDAAQWFTWASLVQLHKRIQRLEGTAA
jgi:cytoskeletal protein CcmA (bactofilin family)